MNAPLQRLRAGCDSRLAIPAALVLIMGCAGGQEVTPEALGRAKQLWTQADLRDYDLDCTVRGPNQAHYLVTVRGGEVRRLESIQRDGTKVELHSAESQAYGVPGLFRTIADELALVKTDRPFGQPEGTKVVMRFQPDAALGYPHWYRRDVLGTPLSIAIEVNQLTPVATAGK